jgi:alkylation response protein AidB-like acyl-CoA dehydrogenase
VTILIRKDDMIISGGENVQPVLVEEALNQHPLKKIGGVIMDFEFNKSQKMIQKEVRRFAQEELAPQYSHWDREKQYPRELVRKMGSLGLIGTSVSQANGGLGESYITEGIVYEEVARGDCSKEAGMVKWMAPRFSTNAIRDCILLHGHYGYTKEYPLEQRLRDVLAIEIADGTSQVSKLVVQREVMGREFLPYNYR